MEKEAKKRPGEDRVDSPEERSSGRKVRQIDLAGDRQTLNVLMLELATMVVAIALAFSANFLTAFDMNDLLMFVFTTAVVIWFWWDYIRDRLLYPPMTSNFPYLDVLVLILISLIPFALRQNNITYVSGVLSFLLIVWALMISRIMSESKAVLDVARNNQLRTEVVQRASVGFLLLADTVVSAYAKVVATLLLSLLVTAVIGWSFFSRARKQGGGSGPPQERAKQDPVGVRQGRVNQSFGTNLRLGPFGFARQLARKACTLRPGNLGFQTTSSPSQDHCQRME
jgi:hypothetical protein